MLQKERTGISDNYDVRIFCLNTDRQRLYKRIDARVEEMFKKGIAGEVKKLSNKALSMTAGKALGYSEVLGYLKGKYSLEEAKELLKKNTRHFAKRQLSWFRPDQRILWLLPSQFLHNPHTSLHTSNTHFVNL